VKKEKRGPWYLLTGFFLGALFGLFYAWMVSPVEYLETAPSALQPDFEDRYRAMIAAAYLANGDLARARARLDLLGDQDLIQSLDDQAARSARERRDRWEAQALEALSTALRQSAHTDEAVTPQGPVILP
jgi:hypothetical protein